MRSRLFLLALTIGGAGCSLLVQFDPEGQPCGPSSECLAGYACVDGGCTRGTGGGDGGTCSPGSCTTPGPCESGPGTCELSTGRCQYVPKGLDEPCSDEDQCTAGDRCDGSGRCVPVTTTRCTTPPGPCFADAGTCSATSGACVYPLLPANAPCEDGNLCTVGEVCSATGTCGGGTTRLCTSPPNTCTEPSGTCFPSTGCIYAPRANSTCDDRNACTVGDTCDGGACISGRVCPPPAPCQVGTCADGGCTYVPAAEGSSCGAAASLRCCGGNCVDISSTTQHCGGCGIACIAGYACESVAATTTCTGFTPANTSGRCTCNNLAVGTCPTGQICRSAITYPNRCQPPINNDAGLGCAPGERVQAISGCPAYCYY